MKFGITSCMLFIAHRMMSIKHLKYCVKKREFYEMLMILKLIFRFQSLILMLLIRVWIEHWIISF